MNDDIELIKGNPKNGNCRLVGKTVCSDIDLRRVILWQYEQAVKLIGIVDISQAGYDSLQHNFWNVWFNDVFNINTANAFGLAVWAKILNVKVTVDFDPQPDKIAFGYSTKRTNYERGNFGNKGGSGSSVTLNEEQVRLLVKTRYFALTNKPTLDNINDFLRENYWKGDSKVWVSDPMNMTFLLYTFQYNPTYDVRFLLDNIDLLPRPACVGIRIKLIGKDAYGFGENRLNYSGNFGNFGVDF